MNATGQGSTDSIIEGVQFVTQHHQNKQKKKSAANMSLGIPEPYEALEGAIRASAEAGGVQRLSPEQGPGLLQGQPGLDA